LTVYGAKPGATVDGSTSGPIASKSVGDVSVGYSQSSSLAHAQGAAASLSMTRYGTEYHRLLKQRALGVTVL